FLREYAVGMTVERLVWLNKKAPLNLPNVTIRPGLARRANRNPAYVPARGWPPGTAIQPGAENLPDARWRMKLVQDDRPEADRPVTARAPVLPPGLDPVADPLTTYRAVGAAHAKMALDGPSPLRQVVARTNYGLVSFATDGPGLRLTHTLISADVKRVPD